MEFAAIRSFDNYITANIIKSRLESEGIYCFLKDQNITLMYGAAFTKIVLQVPLQDQEKAQALLLETEKEMAEQQAKPGFWEDDTEQLNPENKICVHCGSKNTRRVEDKKDSFLLSWLFDRLKMNYQSDRWHCFHCAEDF